MFPFVRATSAAAPPAANLPLRNSTPPDSGFKVVREYRLSGINLGTYWPLPRVRRVEFLIPHLLVRPCPSIKPPVSACASASMSLSTFTQDPHITFNTFLPSSLRHHVKVRDQTGPPPFYTCRLTSTAFRPHHPPPPRLPIAFSWSSAAEHYLSRRRRDSLIDSCACPECRYQSLSDGSLQVSSSGETDGPDHAATLYFHMLPPVPFTYLPFFFRTRIAPAPRRPHYPPANSLFRPLHKTSPHC